MSGHCAPRFIVVIPGLPALWAGRTRLQRQDTVANIGEADGRVYAVLCDAKGKAGFRVPFAMKPRTIPE